VVPLISKSDTLLARALMTSACLPSGEIATPEACWDGASGGATATVPTPLTFFPEIDNTLTVFSARLATNARFPARLMAIPEGCLPVCTVAIMAGGEAVRSMT